MTEIRRNSEECLRVVDVLRQISAKLHFLLVRETANEDWDDFYIVSFAL